MNSIEKEIHEKNCENCPVCEKLFVYCECCDLDYMEYFGETNGIPVSMNANYS